MYFKGSLNSRLKNNLNNSFIDITFKDKVTKKFLYQSPTFISLYSIDSLAIFNPQKEKMYFSTIDERIKDSVIHQFWIVGFGPIFDLRTDSLAFQRPIYKDFIIQYNYKETDTLKTCFKAVATTCGSTFEFLKIYYKGKMIDSVTNQSFTKIVHYKL